jgi:hypothetical protein
MGRFYNKTRTPLSATTSKGKSVTFPPRGWAYVPIDEESSQAIQVYVRKGVLARADDPQDVAILAGLKPAAPAVVAAPKSVIRAPEPVLAPVVETSRSEQDPEGVSIETAVEQEVSDTDTESVASDGQTVADSPSRKRRENRRS